MAKRSGLSKSSVGQICRAFEFTRIVPRVQAVQHLVVRGQGLRRGRVLPELQDFNSEPTAAIVVNFIRVIADDRQPGAYAELMRAAGRSGASEDEALRFDRPLKRSRQDAPSSVPAPASEAAEFESWKLLVSQFLQLFSGPVLVALSPGNKRDSRLDDVVSAALEAFGRELAVEGHATKALARVSHADADRFLTIHKCKGLGFDKVVVLGFEVQILRGDATASISEFFGAISHARNHLVLAWAEYRARTDQPVKRWDEERDVHQRFVDFAAEEEP